MGYYSISALTNSVIGALLVFFFALLSQQVFAQDIVKKAVNTTNCTNLEKDLSDQKILREHLERNFERCRLQLMNEQKRKQYVERMAKANSTINMSLKELDLLAGSK